MPGSELRGTGRAATYPNSNKGYKKGGRIKAAQWLQHWKRKSFRRRGTLKLKKKE